MKKAFTIAEVLITLGIIGVVAALTLPTVITKHQKHVTVTRLKQSYSILSQAFVAAQTEYGDPSTWDCYFDRNTPSAGFNREEYMTTLARKYILPYLKSVQDYGYINALYKFGYKASSRTSYYFMLPNGTLVEVAGSTGCSDKYDENGACTGQVLYLDYALNLDINGFKGPNKRGKDVFTTSFLQTGEYRMFRHTTRRSDALGSCKYNGSTCGYLIQMDGWQIKDDYPW